MCFFGNTSFGVPEKIESNKQLLNESVSLAALSASSFPSMRQWSGINIYDRYVFTDVEGSRTGILYFS